MVKVSVIIVNYNTQDWLGPCIASVYNCCSDIDLEIIVVDNNSTNREFEQVLAQYPLVQLIKMQQNVGFGSACNVAVKAANGDFLFFLNPDVVLHNNALLFFLDFWAKNGQQLSIGCLGAFLQDSAAMPIHSYGLYPVMTKVLINKVKSILGIPLKVAPVDSTNRYQSVDYITGADLFISKDNFLLVGGFDERFFMYFEETDLQFRLQKKGFFSYLIPQPQIEHFQGASTHLNKPLLRVLYFDSLLAYFHKHSSWLAYSVFKLFWHCFDFKTYLQKLKIQNKLKKA